MIDVVFQGRSHDLPGLAEALAAEVEQRTTLLSAREREILENHLLNEVAGTLHELISAAEAEVRQMNDELAVAADVDRHEAAADLAAGQERARGARPGQAQAPADDRRVVRR